MTTPDEVLSSARRLHQSGDLTAAIPLYQEALRQQPGQAHTHYLLGAAYEGLGRLAEAAEQLRASLRLRPHNADTINHLGVVLGRQGQAARAAACFRRSARLRPGFVDAHRNLGVMLLWASRRGATDRVTVTPALAGGDGRMPPPALDADRSGSNGAGATDNGIPVRPIGLTVRASSMLDEAVASLLEVVRLRPDCPSSRHELAVALRSAGRTQEADELFREAGRLNPPRAQFDLGNSHAAAGRWDEALACYGRALTGRPDFAEAFLARAVVHRRRGDAPAAAADLRRYLELRPADSAARVNLGVALLIQGDAESAVAVCEQAVAADPTIPEGHNTLGAALCESGRPAEALPHVEQALALRPGFAEAHANLGVTLHELGRHDEALSRFEEALRHNPDLADAHTSRGMLRLLLGDWARGWPEYEWRWRCTGRSGPRFAGSPAWDGSPLAGRTLLLHAEQGLGDTLQFARYAPLVPRGPGGGRVVLEAQPPLARLLAGSALADAVLPRGAPLPPFDAQAALLSLPGLFGTTPGSVPAAAPYLRPDPDLAARWRGRLGRAGPALRVGVAWRGNPGHRRDRLRSADPGLFAPLAAVPGARLYGLQKGARPEELAAAGVADDLAPDLADLADDAAAVACLDLVVCVDTALAHLAGGLGLPCWVALPAVPDWRWLLGRDDTPWYPTLRLFRQDTPGHWNHTFQNIAHALRDRVRQRGAGGASR